jgi:hypothetical protein
MKHLLITAIAAGVLVGCGNPEADRALLNAAREGNIEAVKQHLAAGTDVNAKDKLDRTPLLQATGWGRKETGHTDWLTIESAVPRGMPIPKADKQNVAFVRKTFV